MSQPLDPIPQTDPLIDSAQMMGERWYRWLSEVITRLLQAVLTVASARKGPLSSALSTTTIFTPSQPGAYRISWSLQVTTAATTSSSIAVTLGWKANGVAQTEAFVALTGNTTGTHGSGSVTIRPDSGQAITYATAYASVGGTAMAYQCDVTVEALT